MNDKLYLPAKSLVKQKNKNTLISRNLIRPSIYSMENFMKQFSKNLSVRVVSNM